jgi:hypothetical protein
MAAIRRGHVLCNVLKDNLPLNPIISAIKSVRQGLETTQQGNALIFAHLLKILMLILKLNCALLNVLLVTLQIMIHNLVLLQSIAVKI